MIIKSRPKRISNHSRSKEKAGLVVEWVVEWNISSIDILAARIGQTPKSCSRFFKKLLGEKILERVESPFCSKRDLVILGIRAGAFMGYDDADFMKDLKRGRKTIKKEHLLHDLQVQKACLLNLDQALEVVAAHNIVQDIKTPDALVFCEDDAIAIEVEKTRKSQGSAYLFLHKYLAIIGSGEVDQVKVYFSFEDDCSYYEALFNRDYWPEIVPVPKTKTVKNTGRFIKVELDNPLRAKFSFIFLNPKDPPQIFKMNDAIKPKDEFEKSYKDRLEEDEFEILAAQEREKEDFLRELKLQKEAGIRAEMEKERRLLEKRNAEINELEKLVEESKKADKASKSWFSEYESKTPELEERLRQLRLLS